MCLADLGLDYIPHILLPSSIEHLSLLEKYMCKLLHRDWNGGSSLKENKY